MYSSRDMACLASRWYLMMSRSHFMLRGHSEQWKIRVSISQLPYWLCACVISTKSADLTGEKGDEIRRTRKRRTK
jgi:hypothetical protein